MKRQFKNILALGNQDSEKNCKLLHKLLDRALSDSSALGQGIAHYHPDIGKKCYKNINIICKDICMALTGKEIEFNENKRTN